MNDEIKKYLDSANFKFKDIDEKGKEVELTLSQVIENLVENNKKLGDYITNLQEELQESNESITWWANRFNAVERDKKDYKSRIDKAKEYINHEIFKRTILVGVGTKKYTRNILDNVLNILNGGDE